jgi:amino acid adenylation domain-containing protein
MSNLKKTDIEAIYPLAPMQQGMIFHSLLAPESGAYIVQSSYDLIGDLDADALERAWRRVVERHGALRTLFVMDHGSEPLQVVMKKVELPWRFEDWRGVDQAQIRTRLQEFAQADRARGFDLDQAPLMRFVLIRLKDNIHKIIWTVHHAIVDGWSIPILQREAFAFHETFRQGKSIHVPLPPPYQNYIAWLGRQDKAAAEPFWRNQLKGFTAPTPLPLDRAPATAVENTLPNECHVSVISAELTEQIQTLARESQVTLNTILQGVWGLLLSRYCGESEVIFGATVSGRPAELEGVESMVGLFLNSLPVRIKVEPDASIMEWLKTLQAQQVESRQYEYSALVDIAGWSEIERGRALFETLLVCETFPGRSNNTLIKTGLKIGNSQTLDQTNFPLMVVACPGRQLSLRIMYDPQRLDLDSVERIASHFQHLLAGMVAQPQRRLADLPMVTEAERHQLLVEWNDTDVDYGPAETLHQLFERQVERTPEAVALEFGDEQLSYRQFNERANRLAHYLRELGVGPEIMVGVCMERSVEMVTALYAILKAGGAYVPLDPDYSPDRLAFMLDDTKIDVLITQDQLAVNLPPYSGRLILADSDLPEVAAQSIENPAVQGGGDNLAYVIYTSGSTGQPKGVMITHGAIVNRILWMQEAFGLTPHDRVLQKTPFSFDVSVWEFFWPLMAGAGLVVARPQGHQDPEYLVDLINERQISILHFVPPMLEAFVRHPQAGSCSSLKRVICSGEALPRELQDRFFASLEETQLHNLYGPTEAAVDVTWWVCRPDDKRRTVPIGKPIANVHMHILDPALQPVAAGVAGELHIGGVQLARGYLGRPELTAEKFIPDPFSEEPSARLYKTGDLSRYLPDGNIEYLGRLDHQVKIRGFRIELGEIEAVLGEHRSVGETVVLCREDEPGDKRLVAYMVTKDDAAPTTGELRDFLKRKLPDYMLPSTFMTLESLPLTSNGKVNRRALPVPEGRPRLDQSYVAPRSEMDKKIVAIWRDILRVEKIGIHDNFFELGGQSLLATQLVSRIRDSFEIEVPLRQIFEFPTVAGLAQLVETLSWTVRPSEQSGSSEDVREEIEI